MCGASLRAQDPSGHAADDAQKLCDVLLLSISVMSPLACSVPESRQTGIAPEGGNVTSLMADYPQL